MQDKEENMFMNQASLHDLCVRIAAGDQRAREQFDRQIPPLVEVVVRRWLRQQPEAATGDKSPPSASSASQLVRQLTSECCARMIGDSGHAPGTDDPWRDDTFVVRRGGDTVRWPVGLRVASLSRACAKRVQPEP
jgi:hypothetical protein